MSDDLESELVAQCELEYSVLRISILECFGQTDVVTCIEHYVSILVRETYWDSEVETLNALTLEAVCLVNSGDIATLNASLIEITLQADLLHYIKTRLDTCLDSKTLNNVVLSQDRNVDLVEFIGSIATENSATNNNVVLIHIKFCTYKILHLKTLLRVENSSCDLKILSYTVCSLNTYCETCTCLRAVNLCNICDVNTNLRHDAELTYLILCVYTESSNHHSCDHHNLFHNPFTLF